MRTTIRLPAIVLGALVTGLAARAAPPAPIGSEFQINTYTTGAQTRPLVASDADGRFVVVWSTPGNYYGNDTDGFGIVAQIYDAGGSAVGYNFQVNNYTTGSQDFASVAADSDGDFVVVWSSDGSAGSDTSYLSIQGRRYNSTGAALGAQFQVNTYTTQNQGFAAVAVDADGDFVVVWQSARGDGTDTSYSSIQGQRYDSSGSAVGAQFQVNTYTTGYQVRPWVAIDADGDFVVVWQSAGSADTDTSYHSIQGQRYDSTGSAVGAEFQVNTYTTSYQRYPSVSLDTDGDFVVVWDSDGSAGSDTAYLSVQGQRYNSSGSAVGGQFQVNTYTTSNQGRPFVSLDTDGDFAVTWEGYGSAGTDTSGSSVHGQRFAAGGAAIGSEFQVNTYTTGNQGSPLSGPPVPRRGPGVASEANGDFVIVWSSSGSSGSDTSMRSIQGQRFAVADADSDNVADALEDAAPNGGDGNGDGTADSAQSGVASLPDGETGASYVTLEVGGGCATLMDVAAKSEAEVAAENGVAEESFVEYPFGLVTFRAPCASLTLKLYYHGTSQAPPFYRKFGPTTPGDPGSADWYALPTATFGTEVVGGNTVGTATLSFTDGVLGDDTGVDGEIVDDGGLAQQGPVVPALGPRGLAALALLMAAGVLWRLRLSGARRGAPRGSLR